MVAAPVRAEPSTQPVVRCAVINGMNITGFWQAVAERFEQETGIRIETVTFGEKAVIDRSFREGGIDLITMHASDKIINLVADGLALDPQPWARNDLVIVGPANDPAGIRGMTDAAEALAKIAHAKSPLVVHSSLGAQGVLRAIVDEAQIEFDPSQLTMLFDDRGRDVLKIAAEKGAYTMIGRIPFRTGRLPNAGLELMVQGDPRLRRPYVVAIANPHAVPGARTGPALRLAEFLRSTRTQKWIAEWGKGQIDEKPVFFPIESASHPRPPVGVVLRICGDIDATVDLGVEQWKKLPRTEIRVAEEDGTETLWSGVPLRAVLRAAGVAVGNHHVRGMQLQRIVTVRAADGYAASFALAELDDDFAERSILLADMRNGDPLAEDAAMLRLVVPQEKRRARWVKQAVEIELR